MNENILDKDKIFSICKGLPNEINSYINFLVQEIWKEERINIIKDLSDILEITPNDLEDIIKNNNIGENAKGIKIKDSNESEKKETNAIKTKARNQNQSSRGRSSRGRGRGRGRPLML